MANAVESAINKLAVQLQTISGLTVLKEFPAANQTLKMPSVTIFQGQCQFTNLPPYVLSVTSPVANQVTTVYVVGEYDLKLQLDIWARNKVERETVFGQIFAKINPTIDPMGLSLQMTDYFNLWARFDLLSHQFMDDEIASQTQAWRMKLDVAANFRAVLSETDYAMITIQAQITTPDNIPQS